MKFECKISFNRKRAQFLLSHQILIGQSNDRNMQEAPNEIGEAFWKRYSLTTKTSTASGCWQANEESTKWKNRSKLATNPVIISEIKHKEQVSHPPRSHNTHLIQRVTSETLGYPHGMSRAGGKSPADLCYEAKSECAARPGYNSVHKVSESKSNAASVVSFRLIYEHEILSVTQNQVPPLVPEEGQRLNETKDLFSRQAWSKKRS